MSKIVKYLIDCFCFFFLLLPLHAQKRVTMETYSRWPDLTGGVLSPDGRYAAYAVKNHPQGKNTFFLTSTDGGWQKEIVCSAYDYIELNITNKFIALTTSPDSLMIVRFDGSTEYLAGYSTPKIAIAAGLESICVSSGKHLLLICGTRRWEFENIKAYHFVNGDKQLLLHSERNDSSGNHENVMLVDLPTGEQKSIFQGHSLESLTFNNSKTKLAFVTGNGKVDGKRAVYFVDLIDGSHLQVGDDQYPGYIINGIADFTKDDKNLIVQVVKAENSEQQKKSMNLKVWSYTDDQMQTAKIESSKQLRIYASINLQTPEVHRLQFENDDWNISYSPGNWGDQWLVAQTVGHCSNMERMWNPACIRKYYLVNINNGMREEIEALNNRNLRNMYTLSPNGKFILFFDFDSSAYCSYSTDRRTVRKISPEMYRFDSISNKGYVPSMPRGIGGWDEDNRHVYLYDQFDILLCDMEGEQPYRSITNNYGAKNGIVLSFLDRQNYLIIKRRKDSFLRALDSQTKDNGFYKLDWGIGKDPQRLVMGRYLFCLPFNLSAERGGADPVKAIDDDSYLVRRESVSEYPNYFFTRDFKTFRRISTIVPESEYNWISSELINWNLPDGKSVQGILYKPSNFDSSKTYPLIVNVYEKFTNTLNAYYLPTPLCNGCTVNPVILANQGYLLFQPDIYYKPNKVGESALVAVESALQKLSKYKWIDISNVGMQGCSFGGYETNYIVSHSRSFKAACAAAGASDVVSMGNYFYNTIYSSFSWAQFRFNKMIWEDPDAFVSGSPIYRVDKIFTPLLLFHTSVDDAVPFSQGIQLFLMLRRLHRPAWLLEYSGELANHGLSDREQAKDFSTRMLQFFDHYLQGKTAPAWMNKKRDPTEFAQK